MLYRLSNPQLSVTVCDKGAELWSIRTPDETEYLWQGDETYWPDRALTIFPYVADLTEETYQYQGQKYRMPIHGFAPKSLFQLEEHGRDYLVFLLTDNQETYQQYPWRFAFWVRYQLNGNTLAVTYKVENRDQKTMYFGLGGHPGINVPLTKDTRFEDYYLEFAAPCQPYQVGFTENLLLSGQDVLYPLEDKTRISLTHQLFDDDAIVLKHMAKTIILKSCKTDKLVSVSYPQMPYLGLWHAQKTDAPYVCIEPWSSLPSRDGIIEDLSCQSDLNMLQPGEWYQNTWTMTIE